MTRYDIEIKLTGKSMALSILQLVIGWSCFNYALGRDYFWTFITFLAFLILGEILTKMTTDVKESDYDE